MPTEKQIEVGAKALARHVWAENSLPSQVDKWVEAHWMPYRKQAKLVLEAAESEK